MLLKLNKFLVEAEYKLVVYVLYIGLLIAVLFFGGGIKVLLYLHLIMVLILSFLYFGKQLILNFFFPFITVFLLVDYMRLQRYLKKFPQNVHKKTVIILGHANWFKLEAWIKPNFSLGEIKLLVKYLKKQGVEFSFYTKASQKDVRDIMSDQNVREVYFCGHGTSHTFQLCTDDILFYCDLNDPNYKKDFIHQFHCGTKQGKTLVDYVVNEANIEKCFVRRKPISAYTIGRDLKNKIKLLK